MKRKPEEVKVLVSRVFPKVGIDLLKEQGYGVTVWRNERPMTQAELIEKSKGHTALFCTMSEEINKRFLDRCGHLDIISQFAVGYDNIDIEEATRIGIPICNTPDVLSDATSDVAFGLMINVSRKMFHLHKSIAKGDWKFFRPSADLGIELKNKTLGVFGLGRIGTEMAKRCIGAYNMNVIYNNRSRNLKAEEELGARYVSFDDLLSESDVLSVHTSLNKESAGKFDKKAFTAMKPTAIFINTARGAIHNEKDLVSALKTGMIWGAGLDVTNPEPMNPLNPLLSMENAAILPHIGSGTVETRNKMSLIAAGNIVGFYKGEKIPNLVNTEVKNKSGS
ncbi:MAG: 2-hydroxyacid dehydrogenase [Bacteroidales bacterium]